MNPSRLSFQLDAHAKGCQARAATFQTLHGVIETPLFMPVGTQATVKAQTVESLADSGSQILLANTYHLLLRPGAEVFERIGGIHHFMKWPGSVLTDSGGYQIFSLPNSRQMTEKGAIFQSYVDKRYILLSPEVSIQMQRSIGSDIMMVLDQCIPSTANESTARAALKVTHRWAQRSLAARGDSAQSLFAIVQGAMFPHLRKESASGLIELPFDGFAIGGLAVGEAKHEREDICELTASLLPQDRPRYLMGVGTPLDLLEGVYRGIDMFDCIIPTQVAKRGTAFTSRGLVELRRSVYKFSDTPLDPSCTCAVCRKHSRAYLHHLTKTQESLGWQLIGQHNIHFYHQLMREIRSSILDGKFTELYRSKREELDQADPDHPAAHPKPTTAATTALTLGKFEIKDRTLIHRPTQRKIETKSCKPVSLPKELFGNHTSPYVIWDIGLGSGIQAMDWISTYQLTKKKEKLGPLEIYSFCNDLDASRLAMKCRRLLNLSIHYSMDEFIERGVWHSKPDNDVSWFLNEPRAKRPSLIIRS